MKKHDSDELPPPEVARRRDAALLKMLKTPHKAQKDLKKPRVEKPKPRRLISF